MEPTRVSITVILACLASAGICSCSKDPFDNLPEAKEMQEAAFSGWRRYLEALERLPAGREHVYSLARWFADCVLSRTEERYFGRRVEKARRLLKTGVMGDVKPRALRRHPSGYLLIVDTAGGYGAIPMVEQGRTVLFANLDAATGGWRAKPEFCSPRMPEKPALLYMIRYLDDTTASRKRRFDAALGLSRAEFRQQIVKYQNRESDPLVRLALGLARVRIDGWDASFLNGFPADSEKLDELKALDENVFEEMLVKLTNQAAMVEQPPANEILFRVAASAGGQMAERMGRAIYDFAEAAPARFAATVNDVVSGPYERHPALTRMKAYMKKEGKNAPKLRRFLKGCQRHGEPQARVLCRQLLQWL
ncbi:MAG: hypothetical protein D6806_10715 [Deltaproteobacteria bacterium]|nr:MAG: hypothetical protein D6806_10715 [Deltaproteobacteria bacterium]